ncbi:MAG: bifunctional glutamate N-acetyltransferase/amino-acid acetyltransferase ArgJ [Candidatus Eiseniibacteriota bacterium]
MPADDPRFDLAPGFRAAAVACGLKAGGALDLALISADGPCAAAGVFTTNRVQAAPVLYDREILGRGPAGVRAVIANAGCANACTGERGMADVRRMASLAAGAVGCEPDQVLVLSTGVIGRHLDMEKVARGIASLGARSSEPGAMAAARAILTTDTRPKTAAADLDLAGGRIAIRGFAKGAGMIHPGLATMLAVVTTDADFAPEPLRGALTSAVARSFNRVSVDGDMSTNDTVLLLASRAAQVALDGAGVRAFTEALTGVCGALARQIARDGEGATRLVEITVTGGRDEAEAHLVADSIARSPLVKTAIHGGDPNWGRVLVAAGYSGAALDPDHLTLDFGAAPEAITVVRGGLPASYDEAAASALLKRDPAILRLDLGRGTGEATVWTCDFSAEYVAINAHYTT